MNLSESKPRIKAQILKDITIENIVDIKLKKGDYIFWDDDYTFVPSHRGKGYVVFNIGTFEGLKNAENLSYWMFGKENLSIMDIMKYGE